MGVGGVVGREDAVGRGVEGREDIAGRGVEGREDAVGRGVDWRGRGLDWDWESGCGWGLESASGGSRVEEGGRVACGVDCGVGC